MKAQELRNKNTDELKQQLNELLAEQFKLRMQHGTGQLPNASRLRTVRRDIARVHTIMTEQRRSDASATENK